MARTLPLTLILILVAAAVISAGCTGIQQTGSETIAADNSTAGQDQAELIAAEDAVTLYELKLDELTISVEEIEEEGFDAAALWNLCVETELSLQEARTALESGDTLGFDLSMSDCATLLDTLEEAIGTY